MRLPSKAVRAGYFISGLKVVLFVMLPFIIVRSKSAGFFLFLEEHKFSGLYVADQYGDPQIRVFPHRFIDSASHMDNTARPVSVFPQHISDSDWF